MTIPQFRPTLARLALLISIAAGWPEPATALSSPDAVIPTVAPNDNRHPAGTLEGGTLTLALRAAVGRWKPEGPEGVTLQVEAFGEARASLLSDAGALSLSVPAPLIRVVEGTQIVVSVRNDLSTALTVHGLCSRDGTACPPVNVPPADTREVRFASGRAGTYHYWASSMGAPVPFRELAGAFVVDPREGTVDEDRILVITEWTSLTREQLVDILSADDSGEAFLKLQPRLAFTINGLAWPATERFTYQLGERVRWRVINLSSQVHPMHLHGFYFEVTSIGNGLRDVPSDSSHPPRVVTQVLPSGGTMAMTWIPEREGNWLFHCHIMHHVSPARRLSEPAGAHAGHHGDHAASTGMAGMVLGVTVTGPLSRPAASHDATEPTRRKLTLVMRAGIGGNGNSLAAGFVLGPGDAASPPGPVAAPGPPLVLRRDEPVEITLVNHLSEATAMHWHGMELDSYYDGVHGWSGIGQRLAPMIEPGGTFVVRFTPPRAGTFIYHTHLHDYRQLSSGLYGPLIVTEPGETFDPETDHVIVLGRSGVTSEAASILHDPQSVVMNGERAPRFVWKAGQRHRLRFINITPDDIFVVSLLTADVPAIWTPLTKDGARLPAAAAVPGTARQSIAVGETYDFEYDAPAGRKTLWLEVRSTGGKWQVQGSVVIR